MRVDNSEKAAFNISRPIPRDQALRLHPMTLAFIGDGVHSLYIRTAVTLDSDSKTGALHREAIKYVRAVAQASAAEAAAKLFDDTEADIFRRARNCPVQTSAKHAQMCEYRRASGFEAVLGFLYLTGEAERLNMFLKLSAEVTE